MLLVWDSISTPRQEARERFPCPQAEEQKVRPPPGFEKTQKEESSPKVLPPPCYALGFPEAPWDCMRRSWQNITIGWGFTLETENAVTATTDPIKRSSFEFLSYQE